MSDAYDKMVDWFRKYPGKIRDAWLHPDKSNGGELFAFVQPAGGTDMLKANFGCLTQVKSGFNEACTQELTKAIRDDYRIPQDLDYITVDNLPVFAEWQRRIDKELDRPAPIFGE